MTAPELLARRFHALYEQLAPSFGYITREETRAFDHESPNGKLMVAVCKAIADSPEVQALIAEAEARGMDRAGLHVQAYVKRGIGNGEIQGWNAASDLEAAIRSEAAAIRAAIGGAA